MHPNVRNFSVKRPRTYALILLSAAAALGAWSVFLAQGSERDLVFAIGICASSLMVGFCGAVYLIFGSKCNDWDLTFVSSFNPSDVTRKQAAILVACVLVVVTLATLLLVCIRSTSSNKPNRSPELITPRADAQVLVNDVADREMGHG
jgi:hypothetical protein